MIHMTDQGISVAMKAVVIRVPAHIGTEFFVGAATNDLPAIETFF